MNAVYVFLSEHINHFFALISSTNVLMRHAVDGMLERSSAVTLSVAAVNHCPTRAV